MRSVSPTTRIETRSRALRTPRKKIRALVEFLAKAEQQPLGEVDVLVVDDEDIEAMNREYLGHAGVTDVISFDLSDEHAGRGRLVHAQLVVCASEAVRQARTHGHGPQRELLLYVTHGLLHIMGYDDQTPEVTEVMRLRQEELLDKFLRK
jgi:probable rRNA maturation factor